MRHKIISILMAAVILLTIVDITAFASNVAAKQVNAADEEFFYTNDEGEYEKRNSFPNVVEQENQITEEIDALSVETMEEACNVEAEEVTVIEEGVVQTNIWGRETVFFRFESDGTLTVYGEEGIHDFDEYDHYYITRVPSYSDYFNQIKKVVIKSGITGIGDYSFYKCPNLTEVVLLSSGEIGDGVFNECPSLEEIILPSGVTSIGAAFKNCTGMKRMYIPESVTSISEEAFSGCNDVTIYAPVGSYAETWAKENDIDFCGEESEQIILGECGENVFWYLKNGTLTISGTGSMWDAFWDTWLEGSEKDSVSWQGHRDEVKQLIIEEGITRIGAHAFFGFTEMTGEVEIPDSVSSIGNCAFYHCEKLQSVKIPNGITTIEDGTFGFCSLTSVEIPDSVTTIGSKAFFECPSLTKVVIPASVISIVEGIFTGSDNVIIYAEPGSYAETWAKENNVSFVPYDFSDESTQYTIDVSDLADMKYTEDEMVEITFQHELNADVMNNQGTILLWQKINGEWKKIKTIYACNSAEGNEYYTVNELEPNKIEILLINNFLDIRECDNSVKAIPYGATLAFSMEKEDIVFKDSAIESMGIEIEDTVFKTKDWGLKTDEDILKFENSANGYYSGFDDKYYRVSKEVAEILLKKEKGAAKEIQKKINPQKETWGGSCLGMVSVMALNKIGELNLKLWDQEAENCYLLKWPKYSKERFQTNDLINYYQLLQELDSYPITESYTFVTDNLINGGVSWRNVVTKVINRAKQISETKIPFIIGVGLKYEVPEAGNKNYTEMKGQHACLAYSYEESTNEYIIGVYDPSYPWKNTRITINKANYEVQYEGAWRSWKGDNVCELYSLGIVDPRDLEQYCLDGEILTSTEEEDSVKEDTHSTIYFNFNTECMIKNAEGQYLSLQNGELDGTMEVYKLRLIGNATEAELRVEVDESEYFIYNSIQGDTEITVCQNDDYAGAYTDSERAVTKIIPGEKVSISGNSVMNYQVFLGIDNKEVDMLGIEGISDGEVVVNCNDKEKINFKTGDETNTEVLVYSGTDITNIKVEGTKEELLENGINVNGLIIDGIWMEEIEPIIYSGNAELPFFHIYDGTKMLKEGTDYILTYKNNKNAYTYLDEDYAAFEEKLAKTGRAEKTGTFDPKKAPQVIIKMKGNYSGTKTVYFKIEPVDLAGGAVAAENLAVTYNGKKQTPVPKVTWNGKILKYGRDYYIPEYDSVKKNQDSFKQSQAEPYNLTITGKGNFAGKLPITLTISESTKQIAMDKVTVKGIRNLQWTGEQLIQSGFSIKYLNDVLSEANGDYTVSWGENKDVGIGTVTFAGTGTDTDGDGFSYIGSRTVTFKIVGNAMKKAVITGIDKNYIYTGKEICPRAVVSFKANQNADAIPMIENVHYTVKYEKNKEKGIATVILNGLESGGFSGVKKQNFKIMAADLNEFISGEENTDAVEITFTDVQHINNGIYEAAYLKGGAKPEVLVSCGEVTLKEGKDYTVTYSNNKKPALSTDTKAPTVTIKGKGNFTGNKSITFSIVSKVFSVDSGITLVAADKVENGKRNGYRTGFKIYDADGQILGKKEYDADSVTYTLISTINADGSVTEENKVLDKDAIVSAGSQIRITVKGKGLYSGGEVSGTYRILEKNHDISKAVIQIVPQKYTGNQVLINDQSQFEAGKVYLKIGKEKKVLILGEDIEVIERSYVKNVAKGTAKVTFRGINGFGGTKTVSYKIGTRSINEFWKGIYSKISKLFE